MVDIFGGNLDPDNSSKRVPVALCLDTSGSMSNDITALNDAIALFYKDCKADERAKNAVEVVAIEFGNNGVNVASPFSEVEHAQIPQFAAGGGTPMGAAVNLALDYLDDRKKKYKNEGIDYYQPLLIIMTDGHSGDDISIASRRCQQMVQQNVLTLIPLAFGSADVRTLESFGAKSLKITQSFSFIEFFKWLSASASAMAKGTSIDFDKFVK